MTSLVTSAKRAVRKVQRRVHLLRVTGQLRPDHVPLAASGNTIYIDRSDRRGREIVRGLGRGHQPALIALWRKMVATVEPALVLDVGANYGELVLNTRYPEGTRVLAIEANPRVAPLLRRAIAEHPDHERMELHDVLAGETDEGSEHLRVDPGWSGTAGTGLDKTADGGQLIDLTVPVRTLDALVGEAASHQTGPVLIKIDTEGSEAQVLGGMTAILAGAPSVVALIEFVPSHLERRGTAELFAFLQGLGRCWSVDWHGTTAPLDEMPPKSGDVLIVSDDALAKALGLAGA